MKRSLLSLFLLLAFSSFLSLSAQSSDPVVFHIDGKPIYQSEFMREFLKSIGKDPSAPKTACTYEKRQALEEYVNLFVNFRTQLIDAHVLGLDTAESIKTELASYRKDLAAPFLVDSATSNRIMNEIYERDQFALRAAHIIVPCSSTASPADSLAAFNEALSFYQRAINGEDFFALAKECNIKHQSPEQREKQNPNALEGDLGYFSVFDMVYPFENVAYALGKGEISKPFRTNFGFHVVKLLDRVPYHGTPAISHIWISDKNRRAESRINEALAKLREGEDFAVVAKNYSDDRQTAANGGSFGPISLRQMPPEYAQYIAMGMPVGQFSQAFHSSFGWHIIRVDAYDTIAPLEDMRSSYRQRISNDERSRASRKAFVEQCKRKYDFVDYTQTLGSWKVVDGLYSFVPPAPQPLPSKKKGKQKVVAPEPQMASSLDDVVNIITDSVFKRNWVFQPELISDNSPLFSAGGKQFSKADFCRFIALHQRRAKPISHQQFVDIMYNEYINASLIDMADSRLEAESDEFANLMRSYSEGLTIFSYKDQHIWSRSIHDTARFAEFYAAESAKKNLDNPDDSAYFWRSRARTRRIIIVDSACLSPKEALSIVQKSVKKDLPGNEIRKSLLSRIGASCNNDDPVIIRLELYEEGNQSMLSPNQWKQGIYSRPDGKGYDIMVVERILYPELKSIEEARGLYLTDFQAALERELNERLRQQYNVIIHQDVIDEITF